MTTPERYKKGVLMIFEAMKTQLQETDPEKIRPLHIHMFGKFDPSLKMCYRRLGEIETLLKIGALQQPEEHLKQIEIIDYFLKDHKHYGKHSERIQRIRQTLAAGKCSFN